KAIARFNQNRAMARQAALSCSGAGVRGLMMSRWMPPQRMQRSVQYSEPARPPITRITARLPGQSGQLERTRRRDDGNEWVSKYVMSAPFGWHMIRTDVMRFPGSRAD